MKNFRFKSIAEAVLVATTLSGCLKNGPEMLSKSNEIVFSTPNMLLVETKTVTEASAADLAANGIKVLAKVNSDQSVLFNKMVQKDNGVWRVPGETYYFPTGTTMDFYAIYPGSVEIKLAGDDKKATFDYTVTTNDDLVAASAIGITSAASAIPLEFSHILSQIAFTFKGSDTEVNYALNNLVIKVPGSGSFDFVSKNWENLSADKSFSVITASSTLPVSATATSAGEPMTIIPGEFTAEISWSCLQNGKEVAAYQTSLPLSVIQGAKNIINFSLPNCDGDAVAFTTTIDPWEEKQTQIVIKKLSNEIESEFTVNDSGKKVKFSKGNLYWDGSTFRFEDNQYDFPTSWNPSHAGNFYWSKDAAIAYAEDYDNPSASSSDTFFAADGGAIEGYTVLSNDEWQYLKDNAIAKSCAVIDGKYCTILKPDEFSGTVADSYTADEWAAAEKEYGLVALPLSGYRNGSSIDDVGDCGYYWSSSPYESDSAFGMIFAQVGSAILSLPRDIYGSVRLVSVVPNSSNAAAAKYSVSSRTNIEFPKATLCSGTEVSINWGDGFCETYQTSLSRQMIFAHTYSSAFSGNVTFIVHSGTVDFGKVEGSVFKKFTVVDKQHFLIAELPPEPVKFQSSSEQSVTFEIDWWACFSGDFCNQNIYLEYSYDNSVWTQWEDLYEPLVFGTPEHPFVLLRGINPDGFGFICETCGTGEGPVFVFNDDEIPVYCSGDLMSLIDYTTLVDEVPCEGCFGNMFIQQPIVTAPVLSATTLKKGCYDLMFDGCYKLNYIECLAENFPDDITCDAWTYGVANNGMFVKAPGVRDLWIPQGWTVMNSDGSDGTADDLPLSTENGVFTIHPSGKKVKFAPGNLFWDGSDFRFEEHQYDFPTDWDPNHVGHFFWSKIASVACAEKYYGPGEVGSITFFADNGGAIPGWTMLTYEEWCYIVNTRNKINSKGCSEFLIADNSCAILAPDNFNGVLQDSYTAEEWRIAEAQYGLVALPLSGFRYNEGIQNYCDGRYWSSSSYGTFGTDYYGSQARAIYEYFSPCFAYSDHLLYRDDAMAVRLVKVVE